MGKGFIHFANTIINCEDIIKITRSTGYDDNGKIKYGITAILRGDTFNETEWFGDDQRMLTDRMVSLRRILCEN